MSFPPSLFPTDARFLFNRAGFSPHTSVFKEKVGRGRGGGSTVLPPGKKTIHQVAVVERNLHPSPPPLPLLPPPFPSPCPLQQLGSINIRCFHLVGFWLTCTALRYVEHFCPFRFAAVKQPLTLIRIDGGIFDLQNFQHHKL
jgi:hypothetical protein